ncbi:cell wall hydrolase [Paenibacillus sp. PK3_47]|uniref:cell wall hydrolase n=1 Tax=Paenibacillus sp. PK3_47 TaxID=2072642 RepID=UPI00201DA51F|nr:cell wall hydrolase [Paenibacillus sp. PK3_47]UQZ35070.1 cell wall hydrolase [Paenibacillus sp. PK3_47]
MVIFRQNRCIALLVSVILVCFSAISLMNTEGAAEGEHSIPLDKLSGNGHASAAPALLKTAPVSKTTDSTKLKPLLYTAAADPGLAFKGEQTLELISLDKLKSQIPAKKTEAPKIKAAVVQKPPVVVQQAKGQAANQGSQTVKQAKAESKQQPPTTLFFSRTELLSQEQQAEATWSYAVSEEDLLLLQKIVMAEAEGEPYQGKVAVANVVLNRLRSANFPDTIYEVIYQKSQFSPVANGRLKRVTPNEDSIKAVNAALSGIKEVTDDTYFFLSLKLAQDLTVHHSRTLAKTIGNHTFYK